LFEQPRIGLQKRREDEKSVFARKVRGCPRKRKKRQRRFLPPRGGNVYSRSGKRGRTGGGGDVASHSLRGGRNSRGPSPPSFGRAGKKQYRVIRKRTTRIHRQEYGSSGLIPIF